MTYLDLLESQGGDLSPTLSGTLALPAGKGCPAQGNPNHHLWNNRGTWWCHFTLHREDYTAERVRVSLRTRDLAEARLRRDALLRLYRD